uniref:Uncharacterized protein n=1 Tax=Glossina pallidipes TaxID=7398 RepID=A0A1B0AJG9_GLOPL
MLPPPPPTTSTVVMCERSPLTPVRRFKPPVALLPVTGSPMLKSKRFSIGLRLPWSALVEPYLRLDFSSIVAKVVASPSEQPISLAPPLGSEVNSCSLPENPLSHELISWFFLASTALENVKVSKSLSRQRDFWNFRKCKGLCISTSSMGQAITIFSELIRVIDKFSGIALAQPVGPEIYRKVIETNLQTRSRTNCIKEVYCVAVGIPLSLSKEKYPKTKIEKSENKTNINEIALEHKTHDLKDDRAVINENLGLTLHHTCCCWLKEDELLCRGNASRRVL